MRNPGSLLVSSDSIFVVDMGLGRANTFRADGDFLGSAPYPATESGRRIRPIWRMADGQWIGTTQVPTPGQSTEGHHRDSVEYHLLSADLGQVEHRIVAVPGPEMYGTTIARGEGQIQSMRMMLPFARSSMSKPTGTSLLTGENSRPQLSQYSASGALETIIRWAAPIVPVDADLLGRMKSARLEEAAGNAFGEQVINSQFATPGLAEAVPYFVAIHLDATEAIWLQNYQVVSADSLHFTVFDPTGQWLGRLSLPPRHAVHAIGTDRILTVWRDADELEYIRVYRLRR
jgi:hypothetical protein